MKKTKILTTCLLSAALMTAPVVKADDHLGCFFNRLGQGIANMATGFLEIPKNIINISDDHNIFVGMTWGLLRGTAHGVSRTLVGGAEFLSSPIPTKDFLTPDYVWDRFSEDTRYFGLHFPGYWTTYGPLDDGE
ncbi:MAG: exosortase [Methylomonas sp.]|nr:MAG: exosortase [Methylomonas sp.]PPD25491.1 MAG: exosortase [Methylomonas sp.]PPD36287.1 MAG: exosortase [Methylomonas sp.]PPD42412.1 MAG: exosortase [Methylomonas sp.]PPD53122.1 MAG: exosortase [Methylomonas sp.]